MQKTKIIMMLVCRMQVQSWKAMHGDASTGVHLQRAESNCLTFLIAKQICLNAARV